MIYSWVYVQNLLYILDITAVSRTVCVYTLYCTAVYTLQLEVYHPSLPGRELYLHVVINLVLGYSTVYTHIVIMHPVVPAVGEDMPKWVRRGSECTSTKFRSTAVCTHTY